MKPIVLAILGGMSILLLFSRTSTTKPNKTVAVSKSRIVRSLVQPTQQTGIFDLGVRRFGL